jgi:hypothetical protein
VQLSRPFIFTAALFGLLAYGCGPDKSKISASQGIKDFEKCFASQDSACLAQFIAEEELAITGTSRNAAKEALEKVFLPRVKGFAATQTEPPSNYNDSVTTLHVFLTLNHADDQRKLGSSTIGMV